MINIRKQIVLAITGITCAIASANVAVNFEASATSTAGIGNTTTAANLNLSTVGGSWSDLSSTTDAGNEGEITVTDQSRGYMTGRHLFIGRLGNQTVTSDLPGHVSTAALNLDVPQTLNGAVFSLDAEMDNSGAQYAEGLVIEIYNGSTLLLALNLANSSNIGPRFRIGELNASHALQQDIFGSDVWVNDTGASVSINFGASSYSVGAVSETYGDLGASSALTYLNAATTFDRIVFTAQGSKASWGLDNIQISAPGLSAPLIQSFDADPSSVVIGGVTVLSWDVLNADTLTLDQGIGSVTGLVSTQVVVQADTTYSLIAGNSIGSSTSSVSVVAVPAPPVISSFIATPVPVDPGDTVTLSWQVSGAEMVSIDQGIGEVTGMTSTSIVVNAATTYTLTASKGDVFTTDTVVVGLKQSVPNILLVLIDDWGTEDSSVDFNLDPSGNPIAPVDPVTLGLPAFTSEGNDHYHTPVMETLAANGMIFTRAYVNPVCSPTRVSIMTGQNTARHRTINYIGGGGSNFNIKSQPNLDLTASNRTLAEIMRDAGYRTIIAGKGHIGNDNLNIDHYKTPAADPNDDFYGFQINVSATQMGQQYDCYANAVPAFNLAGSSVSATAFAAEYQDMTYVDLDPVKYPAGSEFADEPLFITEAITREMIERIEDSVAAGKPFFGYFTHYATHAPHDIDPRFADNPKYANITSETLDFATMVEGVDQSVGDVIDRLEELGIADDTLIILLGDNGSDCKPRGPQNPPTLGMSNPLRGEKGMRYEGGSRVPLFISWASNNTANTFQQALPIVAGQYEDDIVSGQDLFTTILATAGIPLPTVDDDGAPLVIDGHDLTDYLKGLPGNHRPQKLLIHFPTPHRSIFFSILYEGDWKLIYNYTSSPDSNLADVPLGSYELYNLATDPYEAVNLADPANVGYDPDRTMAMSRALVAEVALREGEYPYFLSYDPDIDSIGLPAQASDLHPVILPAIVGVDLDEDGLDDNAEDPNRNGLVDLTETDADNDNTDGDGTIDGAEVRTGTDPLDPESDFLGEWVSEAAGGFTATWPSKPGAVYEIQTTDDLMDWSGPPIATGLPASDSGTTTSHTVPANGDPQRFYRIGLLP